MARGRNERQAEDDLLDWFTISYRTIYVAVSVALLLAGGVIYHLYFRDGPQTTPAETPQPTATGARFTTIEGSVKVKAVGTFDWVSADRNTVLKKSDLVRTASGSAAEIQFFDGTVVHVRPDSLITNQRIHLIRQRMGQELAKEQPVDADIVVGLPDSAIPAAIGYAMQSGIPYTEALVKNRYIGRTFIQPDQRLREVGVSLKFNALPEVLEGKRVVLIETTTRAELAWLEVIGQETKRRDAAGLPQLHGLRISVPSDKPAHPTVEGWPHG